MEYDQIVSPFLDWIANANPAINARAELATEKKYGPEWSSNPEAQVWFNDYRRSLVQDTLAAAIGLGDDLAGDFEPDEGDVDASTQSGPQAPDEEDEEEADEEKKDEEVDEGSPSIP